MLEQRRDEGDLEINPALQARIDQLGQALWKRYRENNGTLLVTPQVPIDKFDAASPKDPLTPDILNKVTRVDLGELEFRTSDTTDANRPSDHAILKNLTTEGGKKQTPKNEQFLREVVKAAIRASMEECAQKKLPYPRGLISELSKMPGYRVLSYNIHKYYGFEFDSPAEALYAVHVDSLPEGLKFSGEYDSGQWFCCHNPACEKVYKKDSEDWKDNRGKHHIEHLGSCVEAKFFKCNCCNELTVFVHQND